MGNNRLISIVDDDRSAREAVLALVRSLGFAVAGFAGAEAFLRSEELSRTDCLLADMRMPGMDGLGLHRTLRDAGRCIPTILVTAYPNEAISRRALAAGVAFSLVKPLDPETLERCIRSAVVEPAGGTNAHRDPSNGDEPMPMIKTKDGTSIFYKDWGAGQPIVFSHGWPLTADAWDSQMLFLGSHGYRVIAHDRRGHGRSSQPWDGNEMDTYADDLAALTEALDLREAVHVGHSTGGGEVARYLGRHGTERVAKAVLIGAVPPLMLKTDANPGGLPMSVFDGIRDGVLADRSQFFKDITVPFYGANRPGAKVSEGTREYFWLQGMQGGIKNLFDCIKAFSETDFTEDLKKIDVPVLFIHGDDDQIVPIDAAARAAVKLVPNGTLKEYPGAPHGLAETLRDQVNADLLAFIRD